MDMNRSGLSGIQQCRMSNFFGLLLTVTAILAVLPYNGVICDGQIVSRWICAGIAFCVTVPILSVCGLSVSKDSLQTDFVWICISFALSFAIVLVHSVLQATGIVPVSSGNGFRALAGFDNPAGLSAALTVSFPFVLALVDGIGNKRMKYSIVMLVSVAVLLIMAANGSRTGILAIGAVMLLYLFRNMDNARRRWIASLLFSLPVIAAVVYLSFLKRASNSGRGLILGVCWNMFRDAPLLGHGMHGFRSQYMLYQADYLDRGTSSVLPMLADNVTHPLNEFVLVAVNFGLAGVAALMATIIITVRHYIRKPDRESSVGMMVLAGTAVMAMFSYPFRYPLTVLATVFSLLLVFKDVLKDMGRRLKVVSMSAAVATSVIGLFFTVSWTDLQMRWGRLSAEWESGGSSARILEGYSELYPRLKKDPYFLYNYAYVLSENGDCGSAARMAAESFDLMPDYDTALFLADNARECGMLDSAEYYYRLASRMCPVRFLPLYGLFQLFEESGRIEEMQEMGKFILAKPVKVNSNVIRQIRSEVRQILISF